MFRLLQQLKESPIKSNNNSPGLDKITIAFEAIQVRSRQLCLIDLTLATRNDIFQLRYYELAWGIYINVLRNECNFLLHAIGIENCHAFLQFCIHSTLDYSG